MEFFQKDLKRAINDSEYDGVEMFNEIINMCSLGPAIDLKEVRKDYYLFWLNDFCYTGWGYNRCDTTKAYLLTETLPTSILDDFNNYKWVVIRNEQDVMTRHELILPKDEKEFERVRSLTRFFLSQNSIAYQMYENISKLSNIHPYKRKRTFKGRTVDSLKDVINVHKEMLEIANFALIMSGRSTGTCGCKRLSTDTYRCRRRSMWYKRTLANTVAKLSKDLDANWVTAMTYETDTGLVAYIIRELVKFKETENWVKCKELMELIMKEFNFDHGKEVVMPDKINALTVEQFKNDVFGGSVLL